MRLSVSIWFLALTVTFASCGGTSKSSLVPQGENVQAKEMLQGVWVNDDTDLPVMKIQGDSFYYNTDASQPLSFKVFGDSLFLLGQRDTLSYLITRQTEQQLWIHSIFGDEVRYHKSSYEEDLSAFMTRQDEDEEVNTAAQTQKDSVVFYQNKRYRGYVFVNPTQMKVIRSGYDDNGLLIDRIYFDNIIYLCVYQDKKQLWGSNVERSLFSSVIPGDALEECVLEDAQFMGVGPDGYLFRAELVVPDSYVGYHVDLTVSREGDIALRLEDGQQEDMAMALLGSSMDKVLSMQSALN